MTPLYFKSSRRLPGGYLLDPLHPCKVKIRFLEDKYVQSAIEYFRLSNSLQIVDVSFRISCVGVRSKTYQSIADEARQVKAFRLHFNTPTYLASKRSPHHHLFPDPSRIFPHLMRLWDSMGLATITSAGTAC